MQYLVLLPMFVNMFQIYSVCNVNDVSWGTKEGAHLPLWPPRNHAA